MYADRTVNKNNKYPKVFFIIKIYNKNGGKISFGAYALENPGSYISLTNQIICGAQGSPGLL
jgi:hypothetical protein